MRLEDYSAEQIDYLHALHARGYSAPECGRALSERWPDARRYDPGTIRDYLKSEEGRKRAQEVIQAIREQAVEHAFADRGSRLDLLNDRVTSLAAQIRRLENPPMSEEERVAINMGTKKAPVPDTRQITALNKALLETIQQMQKEMDPLAGVVDAVAPAVAVAQAMFQRGITPSEARAKIEAADKSSEEVGPN